MAPSDGRREVPDSEDEPMTSSPIDFMDGAADKLSATARVPLQDAQDAPTEPARPHQANAEDVANVPGTRINGLDVDQSNASSNVDAKPDDGIDMQPDSIASEEAQLTEANDATHALNLQQALPPKVTSSNRQEHEFEAELASDTAMTNQDHPVNAGNLDRMEQLDAPNHANHPSTPDAIHVKQFIGPDNIKPEVQTAAASDDSDDNVHSLDTTAAHLHAPALQTTAPPDLQGQESSRHKEVEQAGLEIEVHRDRNDEANSTVDCAMPRNSSPSTEAQMPALRLTDDLPMKEANDDSLILSASTAIKTDLTPREAPEVSGGTSSGNEIPGTEALVTTNTHDPPHAADLTTEPHQKDNGTASSSFATTTSNSSHTSSTREIEASAPRENTEPVMDPSQTTSSQASTSFNAPPVAKTPQEITLAELKAQKAAMLASLAALPAIQVLIEENAAAEAICGSDDEPTESDIMKAANKIVKEHIKLLHEYNELKDVGQGLMGLIADQRGVRVVEVQEEFGVEAND